ncbi:MAG: 4Fe-4S binding protein, partial [Chloroflexi bacterium]|nr:4Fe-4S binding protein [Chloroflexota bacterium]
KTGGWRTLRPVLTGKCNNCLQCWIFCPDAAVVVEDEKFADFDLDHCKGCGICSEVCALRAISMVAEQSTEGGEG